MRWLKYVFAGAALVLLGWALKRQLNTRGNAQRDDVPASRPATSPVEQEMEDQAMARAHSEVASGEYDMQG
ncbi:MAG TPA: hypothetical protein VNQ32_00740 [Steroidobacteraceae bacterium]|nr:hypothetical protein [Steroidobacteraceae bacterium]